MAFLRIFGVVFVFAFTVLFNIALIDIRFDEINYLLGRVARDEDASKAFGIVARYELVKRRMTLGEENEGNYALEARIQSLVSGDQFQDTAAAKARAKIWAYPTRLILNGLRLAMGKEIVNPVGENHMLRVLEIGYFWERNRKYSEAIKYYDQVLGQADLATEIRASVLMHKAFCHSMQSEYRKARDIYERVINAYPSTEAGVLSWKLLDFLDEIEAGRSGIETQNLSDFEKARQYYLLMDYRSAIKFFSQYLASGAADSVPEARFYKGRAHEELGETEQAVAEYRIVIANDVTRHWAREANRRMVMLGEFYQQKEQVSSEARELLTEYKDNDFLSGLSKYRSMMEQSSLRGQLVASSDTAGGASAGEAVDPKLMGLINSIGSLDLTGEKELQQRQDIEKLKEELVAKGITSGTEMKEIERRRMLADNPFRRPAAIKKVVDANAQQLKYIYNRMLRGGAQFRGRMVVEIEIMPDGKTGQVNISQSDLGDKAFENEIAGKIREWEFMPVPDSLGPVKIRYPFEFDEDQ